MESGIEWGALYSAVWSYLYKGIGEGVWGPRFFCACARPPYWCWAHVSDGPCHQVYGHQMYRTPRLPEGGIYTPSRCCRRLPACPST
jgi:hypothetical protein